MIGQIKDMIDGEENENTRTDGGSSVTVRDSPDGQQQLETSDGDDAQTESEQDESTELQSEIDQEETTEPSLEIDQVFEILKNQRRRYVLRYLTTMDEQVRLGELAEQIAAWENEKEVRVITSQERKRVYVGLYQGHLPKMDDVGAISYNKPRGKIEPGVNADLFQRYLPTNNCEPETPRTLRSAVRKALPFIN